MDSGKRPPLDEQKALFEAQIGREGITTADGEATGKSLIDAALVGVGVGSFHSLQAIIHPGDFTRVDCIDVTGFNDATGEVSFDTAYKGGRILTGTPYKIMNYKFVPAELAAINAKLGAFTSIQNLKAILGDLSTTKRLGQILGGLDETDTLKAILGAFTATQNLKAILGDLSTTKNLGGVLGALTTTDNLKAILGAYTAAANLKAAIDALALEATLTAIKGAGWTDENLTTIDGLIDGIKAVTDALPDAGALTALLADITAILADTGELQTDWADGGRLDLLIDAIKAVTDLLPDGGALNDLAAILEDTGTTIPGLLAAIAGYIDTEVAAIETKLDTPANFMADVSILVDAVNGLAAIKAEVEGLAGAAMRGTEGAALAASWTAALATILGNFTAGRIGYLDQLDFALQEAIALQATVVKQDIIDGTVDNILLDTQIRVIQSGAQAILGAGVEWLRIDSLTNGAEIISIAIAGINQHAWTLDVYVPTADAVAAPAADDKRDTIAYLVGDTEGGLLKPFGFAFNCYLQFTNDGGDDQIDQVTITYRSRGVLTLTWGP